MTVWLIGESNPFGSPEFALWYEPAGCSGSRLMAILGHTPEEYEALYRRRNLLQLRPGESWSAPRARAAAEELRRETEAEDVLVLCGQKVAAAFGLPNFRLYRVNLPRADAGHLRVLVIPHPSGLNRLWHDKTLAPRVRRAVRELLPGGADTGVRVHRGRRRRYPQHPLTSDILRDVRTKIVASTRPEPYPGHKAEVLARYDENIAYFEDAERQRGER